MTPERYEQLLSATSIELSQALHLALEEAAAAEAKAARLVAHVGRMTADAKRRKEKNRAHVEHLVEALRRRKERLFTAELAASANAARATHAENQLAVLQKHMAKARSLEDAVLFALECMIGAHTYECVEAVGRILRETDKRDRENQWLRGELEKTRKKLLAMRRDVIEAVGGEE